MAEMRQPMSSNDAGNAIDSSLKVPRVRGVSAVPVVSPKINQAKLYSELDEIVGVYKTHEGCSVGKFVAATEEPLRSKLQEILRNPQVNSARLTELLQSHGLTISSDVMRRHRRRLSGKDGCKCSRES